MDYLLIGLWIGVAVFFLTSVLITLLRYQRPINAPVGSLPACSIILPIKGASQFLESNLLALGRLKRFKGEILVAIPSRKDSAAQIVASVVSKYPKKMKTDGRGDCGLCQSEVA